MTREDAIERIRVHMIVHEMNESRAIYISEALSMAIKALEQEPCEDCISRQAVLDMATTIQTDDFSGNEIIEVVDVDDIKALPSVKPQEPKEGCWIEVIDEIDSLENKTWHYECSICRSGNSGWGNYKYCPDCGTKMKVVSKQK